MTESEILNKLGIEQLSLMQEEACRALLYSDNDVILLSPTGTGKTLAYLLPLVQRVDIVSNEVQAVVIVPSRELAMQSVEVLQKMSCGVRGMGLYGGRPAMDEHRAMNAVRPHIIFATPGCLNDHLDKNNFSADNVSFLIIDEFDKCLAMGFRAEMEHAVNSLHKVKRRVLLSATEAEEIPRFVNMHKVTRLNFLDKEEQVGDRVGVYVVHSPEKDKLHTLSQLLCMLGNESAIVFLNYRDSVQRTDEYLRQKGFFTSAYHGGLAQREREDALYKFRNSSANILISTDLASRGLDIPEVMNIIHYHLPLGEDEYVHRVGRTARWEASGNTFFVLGPDETLPDFVTDEVEDYQIPSQVPAPVHPKMATLYIGKGKKDKISKGDIVGFLCKQGGLSPHEIGRIDVTDRYSYVAVAYNKVREVLIATKGQKIKGIKTIVEPVR